MKRFHTYAHDELDPNALDALWDQKFTMNVDMDQAMPIITDHFYHYFNRKYDDWCRKRGFPVGPQDFVFGRGKAQPPRPKALEAETEE